MYQASLAALDLVAQINGHAILTGYFSFSLAHVFYQWNQLEEARTALRKMLPDALAWQQVDLLMWGYQALMQIDLAAGNLTGVRQAFQEVEQLEQHRRLAQHQLMAAEMQVRWWLAQGKLAEASTWAAHVTFHLDAWDSTARESS
jgi:LuxR family maltose regulon positive regulatory protein